MERSTRQALSPDEVGELLEAVDEVWIALTFSAMHPGWADTPAVRTSLSGFHAVTKGILRSPEEGADTVVWLAASAAAGGRSGLFWFDRAPAATTTVPRTRENPEERDELWKALVEATSFDPAATPPAEAGRGRKRRSRAS